MVWGKVLTSTFVLDLDILLEIFSASLPVSSKKVPRFLLVGEHFVLVSTENLFYALDYKVDWILR